MRRAEEIVLRTLSMATLLSAGLACAPAPATSPSPDELATGLADDGDEDTPDTTPPPPGVSPAGTDWGKAVVESTMARFPTPAALGRWEYSRALFLHGVYLVYKRVGDPRYLAYIKSWADSHVDAQGKVDASFNSLDNMMPGNVLLDLYLETKEPRYQIAAATIRKRLDTYPRTAKDKPIGAFWHNVNLHGQLWGDGTFMLVPFLVRYGQIFNDSTYANDEGARQLIIYGNHLRNPNTDLLFHAYAENGDTKWANPVTHDSPESWCRAMGWYGMATTHALDILPANHPDRAQLIANLSTLIIGWERFQDPATGRWFQVVDKGSLTNNWLETSCSAMYTYVIARAAQNGWVAASHSATAARGFAGVLHEISLGPDGRSNIANICIGTNVGVLSYYLGRPRATNDFHGLGAFLIMYEQLRPTS
jgi:unsaturated rhamnogalacturonyl hydrolase